MNKHMQKLSDLLEKGLDEYANSDKYKALLHTMSKFYNYSANNCLLIATQCPEASFVAGYGSWKTNFNRFVKPGAKAIFIKAPCKYKKKGEDTDEEEERLGFRAAHVFDISDTEQIPGTPVVTIGVDNLSGSVHNYSDLLSCLTCCADVQVLYEKIKGGANGFYTEKEYPHIVIKRDMSEIQTIKTLIHELAHSKLHSSSNKDEEEKEKKDRNQKELEAESVAYIVCQHYGLDTSDYSFPYVLGWAGDKFKDILKDSLTDIQKVSSYIIQETDRRLALPFPV